MLQRVRIESLKDNILFNSGDILREKNKEDVDREITKQRQILETLSTDRILREIKTYTNDFNVKEKDLIDRIQRVPDGRDYRQKAINFLLQINRIKLEAIYKTRECNKQLKDFQVQTVNYMLKNRGMIASFEMGSGKTLTAIVVSITILKIVLYIEIIKNFRIILCVPTGLINNFRIEADLYGIDEKYRSEYYILETPQTLSTALKKNSDYCKNTFLIVDEAHNLRTLFIDIKNQYTNTGKRSEAAVKCAFDVWKILLLTGTPFYNETIDVVNLVAMVKGEYPYVVDPYYFMQEDYRQFRDYYKGIFYFYRNDKRYFSKRIDYVVKFLMDNEMLDSHEGMEDYMKSGVGKKKGKSCVEGDEELEGDGRGKNAYLCPMRTFANKLEPCLKCKYIVDKTRQALQNDEKVLIFSDFKETGSGLICKELNKAGIVSKIIDGDIDIGIRKQYVEQYNRDQLMVLIVTRAGGEGIDLKGTRHIFAFEKNFNIARMEQYISRGIRYCSHNHLPEEKRNVKIYHLMLIKPSDYRDMPEEVLEYAENCYENVKGNEDLESKYPEDRSVDLYLFKRALKKQEKIDAVVSELEKIQIEFE